MVSAWVLVTLASLGALACAVGAVRLVRRPAGAAAMSAPTELPVPDTVDVRSGPEVSEELLSVLPLLGEWHGEGQAAGAGGDHRFGQWIRFSHDGRGFLAYEARSWRLTAEGGIVGPGRASPASGGPAVRTTSSCW